MSGAPQGDQNHETVAQPAPVRFLNEKIYEINKTMEQIIAKAQEALSLMDLEVWPESHWPGFALREADVFKTYMAWWCM